jgi:DNA polymerase-3 subunit epsilon
MSDPIAPGAPLSAPATALDPLLLQAVLPPGIERLAFVDLETTGGSPAADRATEIGVVEVSAAGLREWSTLLNPQVPIPPFIQKLTGITDAMVSDAPTFDTLAAALHERLHGALFVAHNAPFDHGFLRQEFERAGHAFEPRVVCTVKLSRKLYPEHARHNLDALVQRHGLHLPEAERHRALGDARAVWHFWQHVCRNLAPQAVHAALKPQLQAVRKPPRRPPTQVAGSAAPQA